MRTFVNAPLVKDKAIISKIKVDLPYSWLQIFYQVAINKNLKKGAQKLSVTDYKKTEEK